MKMRFTSLHTFAAALSAACLIHQAAPLNAAPFTTGNIVIYRVGDGSTGLVNTGSPVFIDEYTPSGTLVQSIAMPTTVSGANKRLIASGTAGSEGLIARSGDGNYLMATGYDAPMPTTSLTGTASTSVNRVVARIAADGTVDTTTALNDAATANNIRGVFSTNGTDIWVTGGAGGVRYATFGGNTSVQLSTTQANLRSVGIAGSQLFVTSGSGTNTNKGVNSVGSGSPTTAGQTITRLAGLTDTNCPSTYGFFFADLDAGVAGVDTLYIADDLAGALTKFSLVAGTWTSNGTIGVDADDYRGLAGAVNAGTVTLYATRKGGGTATGGGELVSLADSSGYNGIFAGTPTLLATAASNTAFRGVALSPTPPVVLPTVTVSAPDGTSAESPSDTGSIRISRTGATTSPLTVNYVLATGAGQGVAGDYVETLGGSAVIPSGASFVDLTITPVDDIVLEGDETVSLTLYTNAAYTLGATVNASVTITDNETDIDLSRYVRIARYALPHPTTTTPPSAFNLLCQEASSVTYNWDTDTLFVIGDGGTGITQVSKTGAYIDSMTLAAGSSPQGTEFYDMEGLTYIGGGQFVMSEERDRQLVKFTYVAGTTLNRAATQTVKIGTTIGNIGIEGLCYDPQTSGATPGFLIVKEMTPKSIFQTNVDFTAGTATNGSPSTVNSTDLFAPTLLSVVDHSDVFSLSNLPALSGKPASSHALIISQESGQVVHFDRSGATYSTLTITKDVADTLSVAAMTMEGVTMDRNGVLYIVNENGGGDANHPQLWVYAPTTATNAAPTAITLTSVTSSLPENTPTTTAVKLADISITDDGIGTNTIGISGADAASFEIVGTSLFLKAGTTLSQTTKPTYAISVTVDDTTVGSTPDASTAYTLTITAPVTSSSLIISEVAPWSSTNGVGLLADWFEVTNTGATAVDITNWKVDDSSPSFATAVPLNGITSIAPGESVIFIETATSGDLATKAAAFKTLWFGASPPAGLQIGSYSGSGIGLSTGGDAVNLFNAGGIVQASVNFGTSPAAAPFGTFDNAVGLNNTTISALSTVGMNGAFAAAGDANEIGSPGTALVGTTPIINITATDAAASEAGPDTGSFQVTRTGSTASALTVNYTITGTASSGDYTPSLPGAVVFASGQSSADIVISPVDDALFEGAETLILSITDTGSYDVGTNGTATVTIADNEVNNPPTAIALTNAVSYLSESASTASDVLIAGISVTDDGNGTNSLSLSGADAASFTITGTSLYLKAGTTLSFATKPAYAVTVNVDDTTVGTTPDASTSFTLNITKFITPGTIVITEVSPWSSTNTQSSLAADWFEVTNRGTSPVDITGWKIDDNSHAIGTAVALNGITTIAPGESVIFIESATSLATTFNSIWFGGNPPSGLQIGSYTGSGIGLSSTADEVTLFDRSGLIVTGVGFGASPTASPSGTFDNAANAGSNTLPFPVLTTLSTVGTNGAFQVTDSGTAAGKNLIGSPGATATSTFAFASATYSVVESAGSVTLTINRTSSTSPATVTLNTANGSGTTGTDYTAQSNVVVNFALNDTSKTVSVPVLNRPGIRPSRTFTATISAPSAGNLIGTPATTTVTITEADSYAAMTGPSSSQTPYVQPLLGNWQTTSLLTVGDQVTVSANAGSTPLVGGKYEMAGIPDGLGAFDNGDGTFTLLMHHELNNTVGVTRAHGAIGAFISEWIINKSTLQVVSGSDLIRSIYGWNTGTQSSNASPSAAGAIVFNRFCSADLPAPSAQYNAATGLGTQERVFLGGEESGSNGWALATVATGSSKGSSYVLGKFNLTTNGSGLTGVGGWENLLASPFAQDKTVVIGNNDGGTGIMANAVAVYVGTKTNTGSEADKAGLTNGTLKFINVTGNATEIANTTTRATNITSGTAFTLSGTSSTVFSRPEDGAWDPTTPGRFYFVTTDRLDQVADGVGSQIGRTRLWRLNFTDITNPDLGGTIDLVLTGGVGNDANMWDNMCVTADGKLMLQEDVGGAAHNGKVWFYDPATSTLTKVLKHDVARFGDVVGGLVTTATAPFTNDEEASGVIDVTAIFGGNAAIGNRFYLLVDQAHYTTGITAAQVEGGQLLLVRQTPTSTSLSTTTTPYLLPLDASYSTKSLLSVGDQVTVSANAGSTPLVGGKYEMAGIPDGLGAFDNGDGTLTLLMHHELNNTVGITRAHGSIGAFISEWIINKSTLQVVSGSDLIRSIYGWNAGTQSSNASPSAPGAIVFNRFCSADLPANSALYNAATGLGTQERVFLGGEESGSNGWALATVATGANKGSSYVLGKFNLTTNGSGLTGVGGWENLLASPFAQDKTVVIGNNDGGTGIMANAVAVYVGTKTNTGSEADKAGLTNGTLKFINVTGNATEIANTTTRATNITSGTAFTLSGTSSTVFSRPEDGAWDPTTPGRFYFVTTDRLDQVADGVGSQIGRTRLWRLNFTDITNPDLGGTIDLVLTGGVGNDANMWDNMCVAYDGKVMLQEDVGGTAHNGKIWSYDPVTSTLTKVVMHDPARFGDILAGGTVLPAVTPFNNDEESSGIIDVTALLGGSAAAGEHVYFAVSQAHYTTGITAAQVEGGQLLVIRETPRVAFSLTASTNTVNENAGSVTLTVNRYGDLQFGGTATISTANGTALAGTDYTALSGFSMTFAPGETAKTVNVKIANRSGAQPDRSFTASLTGASRGSPSTTTVTIIDTTTTAFAAWLAANGYAGTLGADSDNDGTPDVLEYFFNSSPNNPADRAHLPAIVRQGADLEFRFTRLQNSTLTGTLRYSTDLLTWQNAVQGVDFEIVSQTVSSGEVEVRYRILNPINAKFFQLRVE